jgi:D-arabinose 1-dehydrogenase-like Zn-dependent alcohol dehydrogenase
VGKTVPVLRADSEIFVNCANAKACGISYDGGYQEYMVAPVEALARTPESIDAAKAAPLLCAGVTAFNSLRHGGAAERPRSHPSNRRTWPRGIQFAKKFGYRVAALGRGSGNAALAKSAFSPPSPPAAVRVFLAAAKEHGSFHPESPRLPAEPFLNL